MLLLFIFIFGFIFCCIALMCVLKLTSIVDDINYKDKGDKNNGN